MDQWSSRRSSFHARTPCHLPTGRTPSFDRARARKTTVAPTLWGKDRAKIRIRLRRRRMMCSRRMVQRLETLIRKLSEGGMATHSPACPANAVNQQSTSTYVRRHQRSVTLKLYPDQAPQCSPRRTSRTNPWCTTKTTSQPSRQLRSTTSRRLCCLRFHRPTNP